nr:MAG TPA: hypothetical protein [Crassvirales sp.]
MYFIIANFSFYFNIILECYDLHSICRIKLILA